MYYISERLYKYKELSFKIVSYFCTFTSMKMVIILMKSLPLHTKGFSVTLLQADNNYRKATLTHKIHTPISFIYLQLTVFVKLRFLYKLSVEIVCGGHMTFTQKPSPWRKQSKKIASCKKYNIASLLKIYIYTLYDILVFYLQANKS